MATDKLVEIDHVTDYISREAAIKAAKCHYPKANEMIAGIILVPAADVRPVVLCRDCRHRDPEDRKCDSGEMERQGCVFPVDDDYFCAYGER